MFGCFLHAKEPQNPISNIKYILYVNSMMWWSTAGRRMATFQQLIFKIIDFLYVSASEGNIILCVFLGEGIRSSTVRPRHLRTLEERKIKTEIKLIMKTPHKRAVHRMAATINPTTPTNAPVNMPAEPWLIDLGAALEPPSTPSESPPAAWTAPLKKFFPHLLCTAL